MASDRKFNQEFVPLAPLPTKEQAEIHEAQRSESHLQDEFVLQPGTLQRLAAADWVTKIEFTAVAAHIRKLQRENTQAGVNEQKLSYEISSLRSEMDTYYKKVEDLKRELRLRQSVPQWIVSLFHFFRGESQS